jgi:hypothetical protein
VCRGEGVLGDWCSPCGNWQERVRTHRNYSTSSWCQLLQDWLLDCWWGETLHFCRSQVPSVLLHTTEQSETGMFLHYTQIKLSRDTLASFTEPFRTFLVLVLLVHLTQACSPVTSFFPVQKHWVTVPLKTCITFWFSCNPLLTSELVIWGKPEMLIFSVFCLLGEVEEYFVQSDNSFLGGYQF